MSLSSVDGPGDAELIAAVRGGDVDAYGELFARHVDAARRLARQLAGPGDADDLVSDAFAKVLTVLQRGGGPDLAFRAYLHQLSCADPLTGLASMAHLRGRLTELYRGDARGPALRDRYALVVIEASAPRLIGLADEVFGLDLRMSRIGESSRSVFSGGETVCRIGPRRIVVLASRDQSLGRRTTLLRSLLDLGERGHGGVRIWTERLPLAPDSVVSLLDELSRDQTS